MNLSHGLYRFLSLILLMVLSANFVHAEEIQAETPITPISGTSLRISGADKAINFSMMYAGQWAFYLVSQREIIREHGSFQNWLKYPSNPHFDRDSFDYNLFAHSLAGQAYYLFYRSRGYSKKDSFLWSFASSLAFEFTIETVTEPPSFQDIYQTPIYGTILGMGLESASDWLHTKESWLLRGLGYILNPFKLLPFSRNRFGTAPLIEEGRGGALLFFEF